MSNKRDSSFLSDNPGPLVELHHWAWGQKLDRRLSKLYRHLELPDVQEALQVPPEENDRLTDAQIVAIQRFGVMFVGISGELLRKGICKDSLRVLEEMRRKTGLNIDFTADGENVIMFDVPRGMTMSTMSFVNVRRNHHLLDFGMGTNTNKLAIMLAAGVMLSRCTDADKNASARTLASVLPYQEVNNAFDDWLAQWQPTGVKGHVKKGQVVGMGWQFYNVRYKLLRFKIDFPLAAFTSCVANEIKTEDTVGNQELIMAVAKRLCVYGLAEELTPIPDVVFFGADNCPLTMDEVAHRNAWQDLDEANEGEPDA